MAPFWRNVRTHGPRRRRGLSAARRVGTLLGAAALALGSGGSTAAPAAPLPPLSDPNDTPPLRAPNGQPIADQRRVDFTTVAGGSTEALARLNLRLMPIFAAFRLPFAGRPATPIRGGGARIDLDIFVYGPIALRVGGSYTGHLVRDEFSTSETAETTEMIQTARRGTVHAAHVAGSIVYAFDIGRVKPILDVGAGLLWVLAPAGVDRPGQRGAACAAGSCEPGLVCAADNTCRPAPFLALHIGFALDVALTRRVGMGLDLRYFSLPSAPAVLPVYLQAGVFVGVRL